MNRYSYISIVLLVISLLFSIYNIQAQTYFDKEFKNNLTYQTLGSSIYSLTDTNGYMVVGNIPTSSNTSLYLIRLNMYGDTVWSKIFCNNLLLEYSGLVKIIKNITRCNFFGCP